MLNNLISEISKYSNALFPKLNGFRGPAHTIRIKRNQAAHDKLCQESDIKEVRKILLDQRWLKKILDS